MPDQYNSEPLTQDEAKVTEGLNVQVRLDISENGTRRDKASVLKLQALVVTRRCSAASQSKRFEG